MVILFELVYNLGILVSISIISGFIGHRGDKDWHSSIYQGLIFGSACIIGMIHPLVILPGLIFDGRSVMLSLSGLFFGPLASAIAALIALIFRINQGGAGTIMGILVIIISASIGSTIKIYNDKKNKEITIKLLFYMGVIVHIFMILCMFTLPNDKIFSTIELMGLPVIITFPLATILIGRIIIELNERRKEKEALKVSQTALSMEKKLLETTLLSVGDGVISTDDKCNVIFLNKMAEYLTGWTQNEAKEKPFDKVFNVVNELTREKKENIVKKVFESGTIFEQENHTVLISKDGTERYIEDRAAPIIQENGEISGVVLVFRDYSDKKQKQEKIKYLSYHDQLTGLYNRRFYEEELKRMDQKENLPLTIVMGDVNGLKLINDSFGHAVGDKLLIKVAEVMQKGCRDNDIIARIGGDEFIILLYKTDYSETEKIISNIKKLSNSEKVGNINISISFGYETKNDVRQNINEIIKKTEDYMYRKKLFESPSMRGKTIETIISTLHEKNKREEEHSLRVSDLCKAMGIALHLNSDKIEEIKSVGLLHDIGKIGIEESILNKPDKLNEEEWKEIQRHSEIGYRILSTVNDMSEMANYVLYHHERWDGSGYPRGLKGKEIPLESRIISIVDSYDAMTSDRSYRCALSQEAVLDELKKNSGSQFDPNLVKVFIEKVIVKEMN
ncbi:HD domain-containing phosphohydrolase [Anaerovorax odorimutans]|uniref:HD domain-containing phosphohydrolase n=1 Tax=Anaerovorax odorimutans TaxID=109327 RepID=UPI0004178759|nr:HD domain-containing phosphohydrolase [Anaerovorax odorimutans]